MFWVDQKSVLRGTDALRHFPFVSNCYTCKPLNVSYVVQNSNQKSAGSEIPTDATRAPKHLPCQLDIE